MMGYWSTLPFFIKKLLDRYIMLNSLRLNDEASGWAHVLFLIKKSRL